MPGLKGVLTVVAVFLALASFQGCVGTTMTGEHAGRRFCNVSSAGCLALKAQQSKTGTISAQQARCCD